jgi:hypothetical protein
VDYTKSEWLGQSGYWEAVVSVFSPGCLSTTTSLFSEHKTTKQAIGALASIVAT